MRIALGSDHAGFAAKEALKARLRAQGHEVEDFGCGGPESCIGGSGTRESACRPKKPATPASAKHTE